MIFIPSITSHDKHGEFTSDLYSYLLKNRIIFLTGRIEDDTANLVVAQLFFLESQDKHAPIYLYINSPGGSVIAGNSILDAMDYIKCDVSTVCLGQCASMAAVLLSNGRKGQRLAFPRSEIMVHQVKSWLGGQASDIKLRADRIEEMNHDLIVTLARNCGQSIRDMEIATDRDNFMSAETAMNFGIIDGIIDTPNKY